MRDFAAAAMMRLIHAGMAAQGIALPPSRATAEAHVPLADKQRLLARLLDAHGPLAILRIGEAAPRMPREPMHRALLLAEDPPDLLRRWRKLERFGHSRHRIRWQQAGPGRLLLRHVAPAGAAPPGLAEHLLVFGLLAVLMETIGAEALQLAPASGPGPRRVAGAWTGGEPAGSYDACILSYRPAAPGARPGTAPEQGDRLVATLRALVLSDPARQWRLAELAARTGRSPRSLQRHLGALGTGTGRIVAEARMEASAELLAGSGCSLAEIGFVCGFADQAHFSRAFRRFTACTPGAYRTLFGTGGLTAGI